MAATGNLPLAAFDARWAEGSRRGGQGTGKSSGYLSCKRAARCFQSRAKRLADFPPCHPFTPLPLLPSCSKTWASVCGADCPTYLPADTACVAPACTGASKVHAAGEGRLGLGRQWGWGMHACLLPLPRLSSPWASPCRPSALLPHLLASPIHLPAACPSPRCLSPQVGGATIRGNPSQRFIEIPLSAGWVSRAVANRRELKVTMRFKSLCRSRQRHAGCPSRAALPLQPVPPHPRLAPCCLAAQRPPAGPRPLQQVALTVALVSEGSTSGVAVFRGADTTAPALLRLQSSCGA